MYISSLMLMALDQDRVRSFDRRGLNAALATLQPGRVRARPTRSLATWARTAMRARAAAGARRADAAAAGARS